jgi:hypothetical protein
VAERPHVVAPEPAVAAQFRGLASGAGHA